MGRVTAHDPVRRGCDESKETMSVDWRPDEVRLDEWCEYSFSVIWMLL